MTTPLEAAGIIAVGTKTSLSGPVDHLERPLAYGDRVTLVVDAIVTGVGLKKSGNGPIEARTLTLIDGFELEADEGRRVLNTLRTARSVAAQVGAGKEILPGLEGLTDVAGVVDVDSVRKNGEPLELPDGTEPQDLEDVWDLLVEGSDHRLRVEELWLELGEEPLTLERAIAIRDELDAIFVEVAGRTPGPLKVGATLIDRDELADARAWVEEGFPLYLADPDAEELLDALAGLGDTEGLVGFRRLLTLERAYQHRGAVIDALEDFVGSSHALLAETEPWDGYAKEGIGGIVERLDGTDDTGDAAPAFLKLLSHVGAFEEAHRARKGVLEYLAKRTPPAVTTPPPPPDEPPLPGDDDDGLNLE